jgi:hypothetical protein
VVYYYNFLLSVIPVEIAIFFEPFLNDLGDSFSTHHLLGFVEWVFVLLPKLESLFVEAEEIIADASKDEQVRLEGFDDRFGELLRFETVLRGRCDVAGMPIYKLFIYFILVHELLIGRVSLEVFGHSIVLVFHDVVKGWTFAVGLATERALREAV